MSYIPLSSLKSGFDYDRSSVPSSPIVGQTWRERDGSSLNLIVEEWSWSGSNWLSIRNIWRDVLLISGQSITVGNTTVGNVNAPTDEIPICINSNYGIYVIKIYAGFRVPSGNLSTASYWKLVLKNGTGILQTLDIKAGDDGLTTGEIRKASAVINQIYPKTEKYNVSMIQQGNPVSVRSPAASLECKLVR